MQINALGDDCANHVAISDEVADHLQLEGETKPYRITGHGGKKHLHDALECTVEFLSPEGQKLGQTQAFAMEKPAGDMRAEDWSQLKQHWDHLKELPLPQPVRQGKIDAIVGTKVMPLLAALQADIMGRDMETPVARKTKLGWFISGRTTIDRSPRTLGICSLTSPPL